MAKNDDDVPVTLPGDKARGGVTGHHVRYVLAFGLAGSIIAFILMMGVNRRLGEKLFFGNTAATILAKPPSSILLLST